MKLKKIALSAILTVSMITPYAIFAETTETAPLYCGAYYNTNGEIISVKNLINSPSDKESEILLDLHKPDSAVKAKLFKWDSDNSPVEKSVVFDFSDDYDIDIIHTNDMHGSLVSSSSVIGVDQISALKNMTDNALLLDAGDATQGVSFATLSKGADVISAMNMAGYDGMVLGNHEFDYGIDVLLSNISAAKFPMMSANTYKKDTDLPLTQENEIYKINGIDVGVFALTTTESSTSTNPKNLTNIVFKDEIETAKEQIKKLEDNGADMVIALTHIGTNDNVSCTSNKLATALKDSGLDLIIDGHSHTVIDTLQDNIPIVQTGCNSSNVGNIKIDLKDDGTIELDTTLLSPAFFSNITPNADITKALNDITESQKSITETVISKTSTTLWGGYINNVAEARIHETNLGNFICDSMIESVGELIDSEYDQLPIVAVENGGGIRASISKGDITWGNIIDVLPFSNTVMFKLVSPKLIYDMLEHSVSSVNSQDSETGMITATMSGGFLQIGGMSFEYDPNATGEKIKNVYLDNSEKPLSRDDDQTQIILASNDFLIAGGNDYTMLENLQTLGEGGGLAEILMAAVQDYTNGETSLEYPIIENRIKTVGEYKPHDYIANIRINDSLDNPVTNKDIVYFVDEKEYKGKTDENGILKITVSDGPHAVSLDNNTDVYINNYSGAGLIELDGEYPIPFPTLKLS